MKSGYFLLLFLQLSMSLVAFSISETPVCSVFTPDSILNRKEKYYQLYAGTKQRYSTCTGVTWFHDNYIAALNFYGQKINTYTFNTATISFEPLQEINNAQGATFTQVENLVVSPDGTWLAVCAGGFEAGVSFYSIDLKTHLINPKPIYALGTSYLVHGARFSPDGKYLATAGFNRDAAISLYKVVKKAGSIELMRVYKKSNDIRDLCCKGINFTNDGRFAVVVYAAGVGDYQRNPKKGVIEVYGFNAVNGSLGKFICSTDNGSPSFCCEDVLFIDDDRALMITDQQNSMLAIYPFDPVTGLIGSAITYMYPEKSQLDFPHGLSLKADGKYLAVTNYGDDAFKVYQVNK